MKTSFKFSDDGLSAQIFLDDKYLGDVVSNVMKQKWSIKPAYKVPYNFLGVKKKLYDSSYIAGKELVNLYNFFCPAYENENEVEGFGIDLNEMLSFLKMRA